MKGSELMRSSSQNLRANITIMDKMVQVGWRNRVFSVKVSVCGGVGAWVCQFQCESKDEKSVREV